MWTTLKRQDLLVEVLGGVTMFLVSLYVLSASQGWQGGACPSCGVVSNATSANRFSSAQYQAIASNVALTAGLSTILMGLVGDLPVILAPGLTGISYGELARTISAPGAQAAVLCVGILVFVFALVSRQVHFLASIPEDLRLGMAAGKGGLVALVALRNMGLVTMPNTSFVSVFNYNMLLSLIGLGVLIALLQRSVKGVSYITSIAVVVVLSLIVRGATGVAIVRPFDAQVPDVTSLAGAPNFAAWSSTNSYAVFRYIIVNTLQIIIDMCVTITALVLTAVVSRLGYDKNIFLVTLSDSRKMVRVFGVIGIVNVLISPYLGVAPATPFIQSAAGIVVGARTGVSALVCGSLFLVLSMCAAPVASIIPLAATGPVVLVACFPSVQGIKFLEYTVPAKYAPALFAFFLMTVTGSIPMGASYALTLLVGVWACTGDWKYLNPQLMSCFWTCILLLVCELQLVTTVEGLGALVGGTVAMCIATWACMRAAGPTVFVPVTTLMESGSAVKRAHVFSWGATSSKSKSQNASPGSDATGRVISSSTSPTAKITSFLSRGGSANASAANKSTGPESARVAVSNGGGGGGVNPSTATTGENLGESQPDVGA